MSEILDHSFLHMPELLAPSSSVERAFAFARAVPFSWHWGMFETRLLATSSQVDVLSCLFRDEAIRALECEDGFRHPALERTRALIRLWARSEDEVLRQVPTIWYEWDQDARNAPPLLWECVDPFFFGASQLAATPEHVVESSERFFGGDPEYAVSGAREAVFSVCASLPRTARVVAVASMRPRGIDGYRLYVRLPRNTMIPWLSAIGWPGDMVRAQRYQTIVNPHFEQAYCQIEVSHTVRPYLAVELGQNDRGFRERPSRARFLEVLSREGLCSSDKAQAVLDWPAELRTDDADGVTRTIVRNIHVKLALPHEGRPEAKAYLGFYRLADRG